MSIKEKDRKRFLSKINEHGSISDYSPDLEPCWIWRASCTGEGYGQVTKNGTTYLAHRFSYEYFVGPIPRGLQIDHLCRVRNCVRPSHLEAVTAYENNRRSSSFTAKNMTKTHCHRGHRLSLDNLQKTSYGKRICKKCHCIMQSSYIERKKLSALES